MNAARRKNIKNIMALIEQMDALKEQIAEELEPAVEVFTECYLEEALEALEEAIS